MSLVSLPNELLFMIAGYLGTWDIASLRFTNKRMAVALHLSLYDSLYRSGSRDSAAKALYYAAAKKDHWLVSRLIKQRVDTLAGDGALLSNAIRWASSEQIIRTFIDCGARLDAMDYFGVTPLAAAAARGRQDVVELLLSRGAEVKMENMPKCALWQAARSGYPNIFRILHDHPGVHLNSADHYGRGLLHWMVFADCAEAVLILSRNTTIDVNRRDMGGSTPLAIAVEMGNIHMAGILLANGRVDPNLSDNFLNTPLHKAVRRGNVGLVEMLVENNRVELFPINRAGMSPLMLARVCCRQPVIDLIEYYVF